MTDVKELYDAAQELIAAHNEAFESPGSDGFVDEEAFLKKIKLMGGTTPERIKKLSYESVLKALPSFEGIQPEVLARDIADTWRKLVKGTSDSSNEKKPTTARKAEKMTLRELVENFDPEDASSPIGERLRRISKGLKFLVYSDGREVDVERTLALLKEIKAGYDERSVFEGKKVYALGVIPDNQADENPLYPERPLRPDGTCDQLNRSWAGVPKRTRQFIYFSLEYEDGIDITGDRAAAHNILDIALKDNAMEKFAERYAEVFVEFEEAERNGELPSLLIPLGQPVPLKGNADPFLVGDR